MRINRHFSKTRRTGLNFGIVFASLLTISTAPGLAATADTPKAAPWTGDFSDFPSTSWKQKWGFVDEGDFGFDRMTPQGQELNVFYGKGSSAPSCKDCPSEGGGQFYTNFRDLGRPDLADAPTVHLRYEVKFPTDWDFGTKGGKLPGLYGGPPGQASGGQHGQAWSTRYMWRVRGDQPKGCLYVYDPSLGDGYGKDVGTGAWNWQSDGQWHSIEQSVDRRTGTLTVWYDNKQVLQENGISQISGIPFAGVFFSTFFGGHATEWGPRRDVNAQFRNFQADTTKIG
ncbi:hypothetical protein EV193_10246 [Herbihabitans rhizosphaerae]|uniref:Polysaccharide lyase 14 domain-containing protein n=1 Tax=Herbihabitans rhizosphaerae TaxID=1872711 RepID=A0A4Q7L2Y1_9PSEU|nr:hypothetical protein EV193_10246 [Herbihabitans rhizosphaerae]